MSLEEIKSPLPERKVFETVEAEEVTKTDEVETSPPVPPVKDNVARVSTQPVPKKNSWVGVTMAAGGVLLLGLGWWAVKNLMTNIGGGGTKVTINYWGLWENTDVLQGLIADYEAKNPKVKINYITADKADFRSRLQGRLEKSGESGVEVPDVFRIHATWLPMFEGALATVPRVTQLGIGLESDFFDVYKNDLKKDGEYKGVPLMYDGLSLFYNKDLLDAAGVAVPKSWWDLETAAKKLTVTDPQTGKILVAGVGLGLIDNVDHWSDVVGLMMKQNGVDPLKADAVNTKKMQDVLTFYTLFKNRDKVWDESLPSSTELFAAGKLAFYFGPSWRVFNIEDKKVPNLNYEITTVPQLPKLADVAPEQANNPANLTNIHWSSYWVEAVNIKSKKQVEAWKFVEFLASKESLEKMYQAAGQVRSFGEIYPRKSMAESIMNNSKVRPFLTAAKENTDPKSWYLCSRTFDDGLNETMANYFGNAINSIVLKGQTPESVMPSLRNGIDQLVNRYKLN